MWNCSRNCKIWNDAATPLVGAEYAEDTTDMLLGMYMAELYGKEAIDAYAANPDSMACNCFFLGDVEQFVMDGHTIKGLDTERKVVFSHTYRLLDIENENENENGVIFYQSEDPEAGEFTYFALSPDTMATTYHLEFRYAEQLDDLQSGFEGNYACWNAAAIAENCDLETMKNVIALFVTENLSDSESFLHACPFEQSGRVSLRYLWDLWGW